MTSIRKIGRFSDGQQTAPDGLEHVRVGGFGDGQATAQADPQTVPTGRFSTGQELLAQAEEHVRIGSFGDRAEPRAAITLHRTAGAMEELEAETVSS
jgi:hypothetical protein